MLSRHGATQNRYRYEEIAYHKSAPCWRVTFAYANTSSEQAGVAACCNRTLRPSANAKRMARRRRPSSLSHRLCRIPDVVTTMIPKTRPTHTASISAPDGSPHEAGEQASLHRGSDVQAPRTASPDLRVLADKGHVGRSQSDLGAQGMLCRHATLPRIASQPGMEHLSVPDVAASGVSLSGRVGSTGSVALGAEPTGSARRAELLGGYQAAIHRPLDVQRALTAIKLRSAAEIYCKKKNNLARFTPRAPRLPAGRQRFQALLDKPVDELIADVRAHPHRYSRTQLTDLAQHHLLAALNIDVEQYRKGIHKAGLYEGLHSVAGRIVSATASGISMGVSELPGVKHATSAVVKGIKKAVKILSHELPPNVINPALTGSLRSITDVKEAFKRVGGLPVVAPQIDKSPDMGRIVQMAKERRGQLDEAIDHFRRSHPSDPQALGRLADAFLALHNVADRQYRRRIGLNRTQTYSKGWGMAVNGLAATGAVVTATVPVVGQIAGPAIIGATIPLQWGAGYLDERRSKHRYNLRANTKWGDFLKEDAARIHFTDLKPEHVSESALRRSFMTQPEVQIAAIREVYEDGLGELMCQHAELRNKLGERGRRISEQQRMGTPARALVPQRRQLQDLEHRLWDLEYRINEAKQHAGHFESFDIERWHSIPTDSLIGQCLDDLNKLEKANRHARLRRPGEGAQIVQRYVQAFHGGISTGTALPIVDAITSIDAFYVHDAHGRTEVLQPVPEVAAVGAGVAGGTVFTAATGEVRMSKADNKKLMSQLRVSPDTYAAHEDQWVFRAGNRSVDLRTTAGYRQYVHSKRDELALVGQALKHGLLSGPVGLKNLLLAKGELRHARASLRSALDALAASGLPRATPAGTRAPTISAMKDALYDYPAVRRHLGVDAEAMS
ncbi:hypothetical protein [Ralstonia solanacearum]|uniref:hypothetical protein n=1 Tax=Ralstonia solanacearum TaxID=305 RepID=UPI001E526721|nr:hypothetical protein [Ralstonia solanacearum]